MTIDPLRPGPELADVRASDQDRLKVAEALDEAYADGRLALEEHTLRQESVLAAKTYGDLAAVTSDLVGLAPAPAANGLPVAPGGGIPANITAIMSSRKYTGAVTLPSRVAITTIMGDVSINLTEGTVAEQVCHVRLGLMLGDTKIWVPAGVNVVDETTTIMGDVKIRGLQVTAGCPTIVLQGLILMGDAKVFGPDYEGWRAKLAKVFHE